MTCPNCNSTDHEPNARFCHVCGAVFSGTFSSMSRDIEAIDLGLPSGTKWASCNLGATKPEEYGDYFSWGETEKKEVCEWSNYHHCDASYYTCHNLGLDISGTLHDVARIKWGGKWRMPTKEQFKELQNNCTHEWTTVNGVNGCKFISKNNGNSIFIPAVGHKEGSRIINRGYAGYSWLAEAEDSRDCINQSCPRFDNDHACSGCGALSFGYDYDNVISITGASRCTGLTVRPVVILCE